MSRPRRSLPVWLVALVMVVVGLLSALAGVLVHADWWGMALTWASLAAVLVAAPAAWHGRGAFAGAWSVVVVWALFPRPEGDFLIAGTAAGWTLVATAPVALIAAMVSIGRRPVAGSEKAATGR